MFNMAYLIDTNILIRSKNDMPFELWPTFWTRLKEMIANGDVYSCTQVKEEIERGQDDLTYWLENNVPDSFYIPFDNDVAVQLATTQNWANATPRFTPAARRDYANKADAYLVATAKAKGLTLVTYETPDPNCQKRVKIPDACQALDIPCCDLNSLLRELGITI